MSLLAADSKPYPQRYAIVDAVRGCAALLVVLAHLHLPSAQSSDHATSPAVFPYGHQAVLAFFVISGYCIAASAQGCIRNGFTFRGFMLRRFKRIYPPYLCAIGFWALSRLVKYQMGGEWSLDRTPTEWLQNITLTQWLSLLWDPLNSAAANPRLFVAAFWSLCYEEQFYLVIAALLAVSGRFPQAVLHGAVALAVIGIAWGAAYPTLRFGFFIEYWAAFAAGLLAFYRLSVTTSGRSRRAIDCSLAIVCLASASIAWFAGINWGPAVINGEPLIVSWASLAIASGMALALIALRPLDDRYRSFQLISTPLAGLATISYSLYLTHQFCLAFSTKLATSVLDPSRQAALFVIAQVAVLLAVATVFWFLCERPFLNRRIVPTARPDSREQPDSTVPERASR